MTDEPEITDGQPAEVETVQPTPPQEPAPVEDPEFAEVDEAPAPPTPHATMVQALKNEFGDQMPEVDGIATRIIAWLQKVGHEISSAL